MAELSVNGRQPDDVLAGPHEQEVKELEKQATSLDSAEGGQPFADPNRKQQQQQRAAGQPGQQQQQQQPEQILSPSSLGRQDGALEAVKQWSVSTYKCTKQLVSERIGKSSRTVDTELDAGVASLRDSQRRYQCLLNLAASMTRHFQSLLDTQRVMAEAFRDMARADSDLAEEFNYNCHTQVALATNGQQLLAALNFFCSSLTTLVSKTFEDTLLTVSNYEYARVEYDAYRTELDAAQKDPAASAKVEELRHRFETQRDKYERLKQDVKIKLQLLDENKIRVMQKQLLLFHNAISAYFSGNQSALEATMKQFSLRPKSGSAEKQAFLESR